MRYYRRMLLVLLAITVAFVLSVECIFLVSEVLAERQRQEAAGDALLQRVTGYTDYRLASSQLFASLVRVSNYTKLFLAKAESVQYNRLMLHNYVRSLHGVTASQQKAIAVSTLDPRDDYVIRNDGTGGIATFLNRFYLSQQELDALVGNFRRSYASQIAFTTVDADGRPLHIMARYEPTIYVTPLYIFIAYYPEQLMDTAFLSQTEGQGLALYFRDTLVASTGPYDEAAWAEMAQGGGPSALRVRQQASSQPGYRYVLATPARALLTPTFFTILGAGLLALASVSYLTVLLARRMYLPIRELLTLTGENAVRDEFDAIKRSILALHAGVETMASSMEQADALLESAFFKDLLTGTRRQDDYAEHSHRILSQDLPGPFCAAIVRYNQSGLSQPELPQDMTYFLTQNIGVYLAPVLAPCAFAKSVDVSFDAKVLLLMTDDLDAVLENLNNALLRVESEHKLDFTAAVGPFVQALPDIAASYRQALQFLNAADFLHYGVKVVSPRDITPANRAAVYFPLHLEQALSAALAQQKREQVRHIIGEIITVNQTERDHNLPQLSLMFAASVNRIIDALNLSPEDAMGSEISPYREFRSAETYDGLRVKACAVFDTLAAHMQAEEGTLNPTMVDKMIQFIEEHYQQDISLIDLADHLGLSKNYVSTLFKNTVGSNFKDYLNNTRYQSAVRLLQASPAIKIKDVARQVGCNGDILARLFLRYAGVSPREYQERLRR